MGSVTVQLSGKANDVEAMLNAIRKVVHESEHIQIEFESNNYRAGPGHHSTRCDVQRRGHAPGTIVQARPVYHQEAGAGREIAC